MNMMTGFSTKPLQIASLVGFFFTLFGSASWSTCWCVTSCTALRSRASRSSRHIVALFSGAQLFALGIIGEYLARMHFRMMQRPSYVVRTTAGSGDPSERSRAGQNRQPAPPARMQSNPQERR